MMEQDNLLEQAREMEALLRRIQRKLFTLEQEHPADNLPLGQLKLCSSLEGGPRTVTALSEELGTSLSAVTQTADRLEKTGLVERVSDSHDRRYKHLRLTPRGEELMSSRRQARIKRAEAVLRGISPEVRESIVYALNTLLDAGLAAFSGVESGRTERTFSAPDDREPVVSEVPCK